MSAMTIDETTRTKAGVLFDLTYVSELSGLPETYDGSERFTSAVQKNRRITKNLIPNTMKVVTLSASLIFVNRRPSDNQPRRPNYLETLRSTGRAVYSENNRILIKLDLTIN